MRELSAILRVLQRRLQPSPGAVRCWADRLPAFMGQQWLSVLVACIPDRRTGPAAVAARLPAVSHSRNHRIRCNSCHQLLPRHSARLQPTPYCGLSLGHILHSVLSQ